MKSAGLAAACIAACVAAHVGSGCSEARPVSAGPTPPAPAGLSMALDEQRGEWVAVGGDEAFESEMPTWIFDGRNWRVAALGGPVPRSFATLAWDPNRRAVVLFGGRSGSHIDVDALDDTWTWDGATWHRLDGPGPPGRWSHALAWVPPRAALLLTGGVQADCRGDGCQSEWWLDAEGWRPVER